MMFDNSLLGDCATDEQLQPYVKVALINRQHLIREIEYAAWAHNWPERTLFFWKHNVKDGVIIRVGGNKDQTWLRWGNTFFIRVS